MGGISSKVAVQTGVGGASGGFAAVLVWLLGLWFQKHGITIPPEIATAMGSSVTTASGFIGGYIAREVWFPAPPQQGAQP